MSDWKTTIEKSPVTIILTACVATAVVTTGSLGWFWVKSSTLQEQEYNINISLAKNDLQATVSELKGRLVSIERRVGGKKLYLDVASILIDADDYKSLGQSHTSYIDGMFFLNPPAFSAWDEKLASQLDLLEMMLGSEHTNIDGFDNSSLAAFTKSTGVLWVSDERVLTKLPAESIYRSDFKIESLVSRPFVFIMPINDEYIKNVAHAVAEIEGDLEMGLFEKYYIEALQRDNRDARKLLDKGDKLIREAEELLSRDGVGVGLDKVPRGSNEVDTSIDKVPDSSEQPEFVSEGNAEEVLSVLSELARNDLAGFTMLDALISGIQFSQLMGGTYYVVSAEKKGNVLYLRTHTKLPVDTASRSINATRTIFDAEYFFIGTKTGGILVRTFIPSKDFKTDAYVWTQALLTSLRVSF